VDWPGYAVGYLVSLWLAIVLSGFAGVDILCIRAEAIPRPGGGFRLYPRVGWRRHQPVARPLRGGDWVARAMVVFVLAIIQVLPVRWIFEPGLEPQRAGVVVLAALFYLIEAAWWFWLWRLPRETVVSTLPRDEEARNRAIAEDVASFHADYVAGRSNADAGRGD
jgi:hypothetical protein